MSAVPPAYPSRRRPAVLLAEHHESVAVEMIRLLNGSGYLVLPVQTAAEARIWARQARREFALALVDLDLPDAPDGSLLRELELLAPGLPVAALATRTAARRGGTVHIPAGIPIITSPWDPDALLTAVRSLVPDTSSHSASA